MVFGPDPDGGRAWPARTVPVPEVLDAGFWPRTPSAAPGARPPSGVAPEAAGAGPDGVTAAGETATGVRGFESGGVLDVLGPGPALAGLTDRAVGCGGGLAVLDDDSLVGVLRAWRRLTCWAAAGELAAVAELARRRPDPDAPGAQVSEFTGDEIAAALTLSGQAASRHLGLALDLAARLPATFRALRDGVIDYVRARIISEATDMLSGANAAEAEARVLPRAGALTAGQLRAALARAVLVVDPDAAARRREEAQRDARVRRWREDAGTAALAGYGLPPADVLAADQKITARARDLRAAGVAGTLDELRARAYLDVILDRPLPAAPVAGTATPGQHDAGHRDDAAGRNGRPRTEHPAVPHGSPPVAARVNLTIPLTTLLGLADNPAEAGGFGPLDAAAARDAAASAAAHPATRWCLTVTDNNGQAAGHGCAAGQHGTGPGLPGPLTVTITPLARGTCDHRNQEPGYEPSRRLRHLIQARSAICAAPGCRRPAIACDLDHTVPFDQGGRTCECGLGPLCRRHHRCKQAPGWRLDQGPPGTMTWTTPAGRRYITGPTTHPT